MAQITNELERKLLVQDLSREPDSDEDGGVKTRYEIDSDFSYDSEEEARLAKEEEAAAKAVNPDRDWSKLLRGGRSKANTGPKAVKADYEEARRIVRRQNETKLLQAKEKFTELAYGKQVSGDSVSYESWKKSLNGQTVKTYGEDDDEDSGDEVLKQLRMKRLTQLRSKMDLPQFGSLITVDRFEFLDHVDKADPRTFVVIHLYEDYIAACRRMNECLQRIAARQTHIKFLCLLATEADQTLSHRALPAFLVYKAGKLVNESTISIVKKFFDGDVNFTDENVEWILASKYGIDLIGVDVAQSEQDIIGMATYSAQEEESVNAENAPKETSDKAFDSGYISFPSKGKLVKENEDSDEGW